MTDGWLWVSLRWATFALDVQGGRVTQAAPIAKWCVGKDAAAMVRYWRGRGARVEWIA
jgi:hypothetical protein